MSKMRTEGEIRHLLLEVTTDESELTTIYHRAEIAALKWVLGDIDTTEYQKEIGAVAADELEGRATRL